MTHVGKTNLGVQYINAHFFVDKWQGTPKVCEVDKCECLEWFDIDNLPQNIFADRRIAIENYKIKVIYSEIGFDGNNKNLDSKIYQK